eukprot:scaffold94215_cov70-Phaeocystis_antarctica.AAC.2
MARAGTTGHQELGHQEAHELGVKFREGSVREGYVSHACAVRRLRKAVRAITPPVGAGVRESQ